MGQATCLPCIVPAPVHQPREAGAAVLVQRGERAVREAGCVTCSHTAREWLSGGSRMGVPPPSPCPGPVPFSEVARVGTEGWEVGAGQAALPLRDPHLGPPSASALR